MNEGPRVIDQDVDFGYPVGELAHRGQILQVELPHLDITGHLLGGSLTLVCVAYRQDDLGAMSSQLARGHRAQPTIGACDDGGAPGERGEICSSPISHTSQCLLVAGVELQRDG